MHQKILENIYSVQYTVNKIKPTNIQTHMFSLATTDVLHYHRPKASTLKTSNSAAAAAANPNPADPSAVDIDADEQLLQGIQFLIGLLNRAVRLHVAGDVVTDFVHHWDGVGLVSLLQRRSVLFDDLCKLRLLHQPLDDLGHELGAVILQPRQMEKLCHLPHVNNVVLAYGLRECLATNTLQPRQQIHVGHTQHVKHDICYQLCVVSVDVIHDVDEYLMGNVV